MDTTKRMVMRDKSEVTKKLSPLSNRRRGSCYYKTTILRKFGVKNIDKTQSFII